MHSPTLGGEACVGVSVHHSPFFAVPALSSSGVNTVPLGTRLPPPTSVVSAASGAPVGALPPVGSDTSAAWTALWSVVNGAPSKLACERVFIGNGLPAIPKTLLDKIQKLEFVDLAELLPSNS